MKRYFVLGIMCVLAVCGMQAESESLNIFLTHPQTRYANMSILIKDMQTGKVIESYRNRNIVPPASCIKTLTTATALEILGSDYRYPTYLEYSGYIEKGVLHGDLYIVGQGDPTLGSSKDGKGFLKKWVKVIQDAGIKKIDGSVVADLSYFDGDAFNPAWLMEDQSNYYAPGIFSIAYMDNTMNIVLQSDEPGTIAKVLYTVPEVPGMQFENHIRCTYTEEDGAFVYGMPYSNSRYLTGSVPSKRGTFGIKGDLPNPGLLLAQHFSKQLNQAGISTTQIPSYISEANLQTRKRLYTHLSDTLGAIVARTNIHSNNLFAETIYRTLASRLGIPCTIHNSETMVRNYWTNRGVDIRSAILKDGCGLAPQDAVSAESFVQLLEYMSQSTNRDVFLASLPVSGKSGTLTGFLDGTELEGRVHAKSGTISGTRNYVGYIFLPDGRKWVFAVLINSASGKMKTVGPVIEKYLLDVYHRNK